MRRRWLCLFLVSVFFSLNIWAQHSSNNYLKCSPRTSFLLNQYKSDVLTKAVLHDITGSSSERVGIFFRIADEKGWLVLKDLGAEVDSVNKKIGTAFINIDRLEQVVNSPHIEFVQVSTPMRKSMDKARAIGNSNADNALIGKNLQNPYRGKGVIVGIVDVGFDFTHPNLYDMQGKNYRVNWGWDQRTSPKLERLSPEKLLSKRYSGDGLNEQHGTHVVGIAAGSGFGTTNLSKNDFGYCGVAPESDICLVATTMEGIDIVQGVMAIFDYANEVDKPCVVNLSLGSSNGPHDGTDLFSESISSLTGAGHIVVASSGNSGADFGYLNIGVSGGKSYTFVPFNKGKTSSFVELWAAEKNTDFVVSLDIYNKKSRTYIGESKPLKASEISNDNYKIKLTNDISVEVGGGLSKENGKYTMLLNFTSDKLEDDDVFVLIFSSEKDVHARAVMNCSFSKAGAIDGKIKKGKTDHSTGIPAEGKDVISVGNYVTRSMFKNINNESLMYADAIDEEISSTSSYGPTYDGRYCPLVTAPGTGILSSYNKFYVQENQDATKQTLMAKTVFDKDFYPWGLMSGTSMSSPYVTGTVALWLQADPTLTPADIRGILARTSKSDDKTGACPNDRWGYGKIDTFNGLLDLLDLSTSNENIFVKHPEEAVSVFADAEGRINIRWAEKPEYFTADVFDISGRKVSSETIGHAVSNEYVLSAVLMQSGIYIVKMDTDKGTVTRKIKF